MRRRRLNDPDPIPTKTPKTRRSNGAGGLKQHPTSGMWIARFTDSNGRRVQRSTRTTNRRAAERVLAKLTADVALRLGGVVTPEMDDQRDRAKQAVGKLVDDYAAHLHGTASGRHAAEQIRRITTTFQTAKIVRWADLTPDRVERTLKQLADELGWAPSTGNAWLVAVKGFTRWVLQRRRADVDPLACLKRLKTIRTEHRRSLTGEEAARLVAAAETGETAIGRTNPGRAHFRKTGEELAGGVRWSMTGPERACLYAVALDTAQRRSALGRLTVADVDLTGATVRVKAKANTKSRETLNLPLRAETVERLRVHVADRLPTVPVFNLPADHEAADLVRDDLAEARGRWIAEGDTAEDRADRAGSDFLADIDTEGRRVDFHCLRATCASLLAASGATLATIARVTGHSTATETLQRHYLKSDAGQVRAAVDALPPLRLTGTDSHQPWPQGSPKGSPTAVRSGGGPWCPVRSEAETAQRPGMQNVPTNTGKTALTRGQDGDSGSAPSRTRTLDPLIKSQLL